MSTEPVADQVEQWMAWLDNEIAKLTRRREALTGVLAAYDSPPPATTGVKMTVTLLEGGGGGGNGGGGTKPKAAKKPKAVHKEPPASTTPPPKHRDRSDRNTGRRPGPKSDKPDYPVIAAEVIRMRATGESVATGLAAKFNVPLSTSKNWVHRCIELGLLPKEEARLKVIEDNTVSDTTEVAYDGPAVAASYLEAVRAGVRPVQNVADHFGVDRTVAADWIRRARDAGLLPPANEPQLPDGERREILNAYKPEALA